MLEPLAGMFAHTAGTIILGAVLPFAIAIGVGLVWIGILRRRAGAVVFGVAFPTVVVIVAILMRGHGSSRALEAGITLSDASLDGLLPISIGFAIVAFLVGMLPHIVRAYRA